MYFEGLIIGAATFLTIGMFHPLVIKAEYYLGLKSNWLFGICGVASLVASMFVENSYVSIILGVVGWSCFWSIHEVFQQKKRVQRGWFPMNPKRKYDYEPLCKENEQRKYV
ncbi:MAG: DUF4491 family protein [Paludibacteraceae bacterium]|nr:DUF4491 family protein [Paludibacteraceae bacterium]